MSFDDHSDLDLCYLDGIADYLEHLDGRRDDSIPDDLTGPALVAWLAGWREAEEAA